MSDAPDPPRKHYGFKPREFESANTHPPMPGRDAAPPKPDPGIVAADTSPIDVRDLNRVANAGRTPLGKGPAPNKENEIHDVLRENFAVANAAGLNEVKPNPGYVSARQRRQRRLLLVVLLFDVPMGLFAWYIGPSQALPFVCALAAIGMITAQQIWHTYFLNTD